MSHCKACDAPLPLSYIDENEEHEEYVCSHCRKKTAQALAMNEWDFEGQWWDRNWEGKEYHEQT